jgi:hypothetical protein
MWIIDSRSHTDMHIPNVVYGYIPTDRSNVGQPKKKDQLTLIKAEKILEWFIPC